MLDRGDKSLSKLSGSALALILVSLPAAGADAATAGAVAPLAVGTAVQVDRVEVPPVPDCYPFVETGSDLPLGEIVRGSEPLQLTFGSGALVHVERFEDFPLAAGQRYEVVRDEGDFRHPGTGEVVGRAMSLRGVAEIVDVEGGRALARLGSVCMEVESGDLLRPLPEEGRPSFGVLPGYDFARLVSARPDDATVVMGFRSTVVMDASSDGHSTVNVPRETYAQGDVLTIDRGREAGWAVGDVVLLYDDEPLQQQGAQRHLGIPEVIGRAVLFRVEDRTATMIVTDSVKAVSLGQRARRIGSVEPGS